MIDLKRTLFENRIKQQDIATHFDVSKQRVWHWVNVSLPTPWERLLKQYFIVNDIKIEKKIVKKI